MLLHTAAGLGNAVTALATARVNRAPLVVVVGQQDRRHLAREPFLAGQAAGTGGRVPGVGPQPPRAQDVPGAVARAWHEAKTARGPAIVIVPMDDWHGSRRRVRRAIAAPARLCAPPAADPAAVRRSRRCSRTSRSPALVVGAGADDAGRRWAALVALAERLACPVWQESFGARAGFPQDHPLFAGHLPPRRARLRDTLGRHDFVLAVGAPAFRQYPYEPGPFAPEARASPSSRTIRRRRTAARRGSPCSDRPASARRALAAQLRRARGAEPRARRPPAPPPPAADGRLRAGDVLAALAERLPKDAVLVEEAPSNRPELHRRIPSRAPLGFLSAAMGGLGFALPAAIGVRMALPERPVVAAVGDGSSLYSIQALWSAAYYRVGGSSSSSPTAATR